MWFFKVCSFCQEWPLTGWMCSVRHPDRKFSTQTSGYTRYTCSVRHPVVVSYGSRLPHTFPFPPLNGVKCFIVVVSTSALYRVAQSQLTLFDTRRRVWNEIHQFCVRSKQFIMYLLLSIDILKVASLICKTLSSTIHEIVKDLANQLLIYVCSFIPNRTLYRLYCVWAISVYAFFLLSP